MCIFLNLILAGRAQTRFNPVAGMACLFYTLAAIIICASAYSAFHAFTFPLSIRMRANEISSNVDWPSSAPALIFGFSKGMLVCFSGVLCNGIHLVKAHLSVRVCLDVV